jgi:hypothetical protein
MSDFVIGMAAGAGIVMACGVIFWVIWAMELWRRS